MTKYSLNPCFREPRIQSLWLTLVFVLTASAQSEDLGKLIADQSLSDLEERRAIIEEELDHLARYSLRSGVGPIGFRSKANESSNTKETFQINIGKETPIDMVVLVPTLWRDTQTGFRADGFPRSFKVVAGNGDASAGKTVASFELDSDTSNRLAPFIVPCQDLVASWIRLEATQLSPRAFDNKYTLQLSEMMLFSGTNNVALGGSVVTSSNQSSNTRAWDPQYLVDGSLPYLMDAAQGSQSVSYVSTDIEDTSSITIDLDSTYAIEQINLHTVDQSDTVPQAFAGDFGFPYHLIVE